MKKMFKYLKPYWLLALISPIMMMGEVMIDLLQPKLMAVIVDCGILGGGDVSSSSWGSTIMRLIHGDGAYTSMQVIITIGVTMLLSVCIGGFFGVSCAFTAAKAAQGFGHDLRCDAYRHVMSLSIEQTDKFTTGSLVTRMTNDISMITDFMESIMRHFVRAPVFLVGGAVMLLTLDLSFGTVLLCAIPVLLFLSIFIIAKATPLFSVVQTKLDKVNSVVQENVSGARVVKAYVREEYEGKRFDIANNDLKSINMRVLIIISFLHPIINIIMNVSVVAVILIGGFRAQVQGTSIGAIMAAVTYVTQVLSSVMMISMVFQSVSKSVASAKRVNEILDSDPIIRSGNEDGKDTDICVSFKNAGFRYPGTAGNPVLHNIDLDIKRGEMLAVIGSTGSGKSSLVNLIPRFYDTTEGDVYVDGVNVKDYDLKKLRQKIGFVMQKSELFSDTIANNIKWGKPDADNNEIKEAADTAQSSEFIEGFSDKYDTYIAEKGASLSGGQKQRLSITRALVRRPEIIIMDDSTSALDLSTEAKLRGRLREKLKGTTVIMIAQRIASVREADRIAVIENGTIKDCAPHDELMKISETYKEIYSSQMRKEDENREAVSVNE